MMLGHDVHEGEEVFLRVGRGGLVLRVVCELPHAPGRLARVWFDVPREVEIQFRRRPPRADARKSA
jgi:hypothetical protein